jgi:hypothetical protein
MRPALQKIGTHDLRHVHADSGDFGDPTGVSRAGYHHIYIEQFQLHRLRIARLFFLVFGTCLALAALFFF